MSYNYVYYKDEETICNAASDVLEHGLTCNKMKSSQGEINMVRVLFFLCCSTNYRYATTKHSVNY